MKLEHNDVQHQHSFQLVKDGKGDQKLRFQFGLPGDPHLPAYQRQDKEHPRYESPAKKQKDKARAAAHQALLVKKNVPLHQNVADSAAKVTNFPTYASVAAPAFKSPPTPPNTPVLPSQQLFQLVPLSPSSLLHQQTTPLPQNLCTFSSFEISTNCFSL